MLANYVTQNTHTSTWYWLDAFGNKRGQLRGTVRCGNATSRTSGVANACDSGHGSGNPSASWKERPCWRGERQRSSTRLRIRAHCKIGRNWPARRVGGAEKRQTEAQCAGIIAREKPNQGASRCTRRSATSSCRSGWPFRGPNVDAQLAVGHPELPHTAEGRLGWRHAPAHAAQPPRARSVEPWRCSVVVAWVAFCCPGTCHVA